MHAQGPAPGMALPSVSRRCLQPIRPHRTSGSGVTFPAAPLSNTVLRLRLRARRVRGATVRPRPVGTSGLAADHVRLVFDAAVAE